jgi:hypothetical protein
MMPEGEGAIVGSILVAASWRFIIFCLRVEGIRLVGPLGTIFVVLELLELL